MSYRVNASSSAGAVSVPVSSSEDAWAKADALASKGHMNIVIIDAGTGMPVRRKPALSEGAAGTTVLSRQISGRGGCTDSAGVTRGLHAAAGAQQDM